MNTLRNRTSALLLGIALCGLASLAAAAPTVSLSAPANAAVYLAPATLAVSASVTPSAGTTIARVDFYQGGTLIGTDTTTPYSVTWSNAPAGTYSLTAKATDSAGGVTTSAPVSLTVNATNAPPTVSLTAPADNASYTLPATITLGAWAFGVEDNTPITSLEFYQGTTLIGSGSVIPGTISTLTWTPTAAGTYSLTAKATDSAGGVTTSAPRAVTIQTAAAAQVYYLHTDHLNTPRLVTDETNTVIWRATPVSEPFGMGPPEEDPDGNGTPFVLNLRFPGQYFDKESNLSYNYFRDYNPQTGRYIQSDPIGLMGGINTYSYVAGNPLAATDPLGLAAGVKGVCIGPFCVPVVPISDGGTGGQSSASGTGNGALDDALGGSKSFPQQCPDDNDRCEKAKQDAQSRYWKLTTKRIPQYLSGGTGGSDATHYDSILQLQSGLRDAIRRVRLYCKPLPAEVDEWERAANQVIPIMH